MYTRSSQCHYVNCSIYSYEVKLWIFVVAKIECFHQRLMFFLLQGQNLTHVTKEYSVEM